MYIKPRLYWNLKTNRGTYIIVIRECITYARCGCIHINSCKYSHRSLSKTHPSGRFEHFTTNLIFFTHRVYKVFICPLSYRRYLYPILHLRRNALLYHYIGIRRNTWFPIRCNLVMVYRFIHICIYILYMFCSSPLFRLQLWTTVKNCTGCIRSKYTSISAI